MGDVIYLTPIQNALKLETSRYSAVVEAVEEARDCLMANEFVTPEVETAIWRIVRATISTA